MSEQDRPVSTSPPIGTRSNDGQFRWDGQQWAPIVGAEPTAWTRPLQLVTAGLLTLAAVLSLVSTLVNVDSLRRGITDQLHASGISGSQLDQQVTVSLAVGIGFTVFLAVLYVVTAIGSLRGWSWAFWVALVLLGLSSLFALFGLVGLLTGSTQTVPAAWAWAGEIVQLAGVAVFVSAVVALTRFGAWARRQPGP